MEPLHYGIIFVLILYVAVCFGKIAGRNGRNPILWGVLSIVTPINLVILGYWAFSGGKRISSTKTTRNGCPLSAFSRRSPWPSA